MADLLLDSLEVLGFRGFRHLRIPHLGRVNLVVGKNNIGKSTLLESLRLYAERGSSSVVWALLGSRDEMRGRSVARREATEVEDPVLAVRYLFYGRPDLRSTPKPIRIGSIHDATETITISITRRRTPNEEISQMSLFSVEDEPVSYRSSTELVLTVVIDDRARYGYTLDAPFRRADIGPESVGLSEIANVYVPANGLSRGLISSLWDKTALTDREDEVLGALRIIAPIVERLTIIGGERAAERVPIVKIREVDSPVPLRNMGEGMNRIFGVALALVNAQNGILLIDEIESGLHYSVQPDLWRLVFEVAKNLNIQVFATSHSWDCIEAFQRIAVADRAAEGMLIRLEMQDQDIVATLFNERELTIATRNDIEVR